jgi:hypothetical protein
MICAKCNARVDDLLYSHSAILCQECRFQFIKSPNFGLYAHYLILKYNGGNTATCDELCHKIQQMWADEL